MRGSCHKRVTLLGNKPTDLTDESPCKQEADTRMMLHVRRDAQQGDAKAYLRTVDSDIVVLAVSVFQKIGLEEHWIGF